MEGYKETEKCCICGKKYIHWGNNAQPIKDGRCCDECNSTIVIPERIRRLYKKESK